MPKLVNSVPKYRKHRASGQAVVTIAARDHYLGPYGTKASRIEYDRLISEWLAAGRHLPVQPEDISGLTIAEVMARYLRHVRDYYVKAGRPIPRATSSWYSAPSAGRTATPPPQNSGH